MTPLRRPSRPSSTQCLRRAPSGAARVAIPLLALAGCGNGDGGYPGTQADLLGVGAECRMSADCAQLDGLAQTCLSFKGGYCGIRGCASDLDCPSAAACVLHDDGETYCFRVCASKSECNVNRAPGNEANCSSSVDFVDPRSDKACVPPSN
jgi:hypothetical protein